MVPVLGIAILNGHDHLGKMLSSVDVDVGRIVIVDNGDVVPDSETMTVIRPRVNLGVAASWNLIMRTVPGAPWWLITNHDIILPRGDLARLAHEMDEDSVVMLGGMHAFGVGRNVIGKAGWFDESFHPAYFEDNDFDYRCRLAGVRLISLPSAMLHATSSTIREDRHYDGQNTRTFGMNQSLYLRKWGGEPYREKFDTPYNKGGDFRDWRLDIDRLRDQQWDRADGASMMSVPAQEA